MLIWQMTECRMTISIETWVARPDSQDKEILEHSQVSNHQDVINKMISNSDKEVAVKATLEIVAFKMMMS